MIDRKQAALLMSSNRHPSSCSAANLEAIYSAADEPTRAILERHPDLRPKLHSLQESLIRANQERLDYQAAINTLRSALDPEGYPVEKARASDDGDQDQAERG